MKIEFQSEVLRYMIQDKTARKFLGVIDKELFDGYSFKIIFDILKSYYEEYRSQPSLAGMLQYFDTEIKKHDVSKDVYASLESTIKSCYLPIKANLDQIKDEIVVFYQKQLTKSLFTQYADKINDGDKELFSVLQKQMRKIAKVGERNDEQEANRGEFLLKDYRVGNYSITEGAPTFLKGVNKMTSTGGFYSPQLVIFMGAPKSFKTGTLINIAVNYVRDGYKVYYVDCENGKDRIRDKARQCMLGCTFSELVSGKFDRTLKEMVGRFKVMGGDMKIDFYPAHSKTVGDVEDELDYLKEEYGWEPDIICWDYLDLMRPIDSRIKEKRLQIQATYFDAIKLQNKRGLFGIGLSQVNKDAVNAPVISMKHFAEDFGKAANCHAAFALCGTEEEREAGYIRITPVVQRDGVRYNSKHVCLLKVDEARMSLDETSFEEATKILSRLNQSKSKVKRIGRRSKTNKNLKDE